MSEDLLNQSDTEFHPFLRERLISSADRADRLSVHRELSLGHAVQRFAFVAVSAALGLLVLWASQIDDLGVPFERAADPAQPVNEEQVGCLTALTRCEPTLFTQRLLVLGVAAALYLAFCLVLRRSFRSPAELEPEPLFQRDYDEPGLLRKATTVLLLAAVVWLFGSTVVAAIRVESVAQEFIAVDPRPGDWGPGNRGLERVGLLGTAENNLYLPLIFIKNTLGLILLSLAALLAWIETPRNTSIKRAATLVLVLVPFLVIGQVIFASTIGYVSWITE